jgi:hypothetical protein
VANVEEVVLTKSVPAATYVITAKLTLFQAAADNGDCSVSAGNQPVDSVAVIPADAGARTPITLIGVAAASPTGPITVSCLVDAGVGTAQNIKITAIPVSSVG